MANRIYNHKPALLAAFVGALLLMGTAARATEGPQIQAQQGIIQLAALHSSARSGKTYMTLRLRRGLRGHGHVGVTRTLHVAAYDGVGKILGEQDVSLSKSLTYLRVELPDSYARAARLTAGLR